MFYSTVPPEQYVETIDRLKKDYEEVRLYNVKLLEKNKELSSKAFNTGLTTDELQSIHGLIQMQIKLIKELQDGVESDTDVLKIHSAVTPLAVLVSLVSKPTD